MEVVEGPMEWMWPVNSWPWVVEHGGQFGTMVLRDFGDRDCGLPSCILRKLHRSISNTDRNIRFGYRVIRLC